MPVQETLALRVTLCHFFLFEIGAKLVLFLHIANLFLKKQSGCCLLEYFFSLPLHFEGKIWWC